MRAVALTVSVVVATLLLYLSFPRFSASLVGAPAFQAVQLALGGKLIRPESYERAVGSLTSSLFFLDRRQARVGLAVIYENAGRQAVSPAKREELYDASLEALDRSFHFSPVQPMAWLLRASILLDRYELDASARAFEMSMRTAHYLNHQTRARVVIGSLLWDRLSEEVRHRLLPSIASVAERETGLVAELAADSAIADSMIDQLAAMPDGGILLAARLRAAVRRYEYARSVEAAQPTEATSMRTIIAATALLVTATVPTLLEAMTVEEYLTITRGDDPEQEATSVVGYLVGVLDGLVMLGDFNRREGNPLFCMPAQDVVSIDVTEFKDALDAMLAQFQAEVPDFNEFARTRSVGLAALQLLTIMYPCDA